MGLRGTLLENQLDLYALQRITLVPSDTPTGDLYIDGEPYPPVVGGGAVNSVNGESGTVVLTSDDIDDTGQTHKFATAAQLAKVDNISITQPVDLDALESAVAAHTTELGYISVTQAVDLDQMESDVATNNAKVSNATHTGEVTGDTSLTLDKTAISNRSSAAPTVYDYVLYGDTSASDALYKCPIGDLPITRPVASTLSGSSVTPNADAKVNGITPISLDHVTSTLINNPSGTPVTGQTLELWLIQNGTGSCLATWGDKYKFNAIGGTPTLSITASAYDIFVFQYNGSVWMGTVKLLKANA